MEIEKRGISQVVFGFLPHQTVDLRNRTWKVRRWSNPTYVPIDQDSVHEELLHAVSPWSRLQLDNELAANLRRGMTVHFVTPSSSGVEVEAFPKLFKCRACSRLEKSDEKSCRCGAKLWAAFPFVSYHSCGLLREPYVDVCASHRQVRVNNPRSNNARDLRFSCPICNAEVQKGFRWLSCECGNGTIDYNIHRAGTVYNPHCAVIVNPPSEQLAREMRGKAARINALDWVLDGMHEEGQLRHRLTLDGLIEMFIGNGISAETARKMAQAAAAEGDGRLSSGDELPLTEEAIERGTSAALKIVYATAGGRTDLNELRKRATPSVAELYNTKYPSAISGARLEGVELLDDFPVLTAYFGYTRGDNRLTQSRLRWYKDESGNLQMHGLRAHTEALLFRLDPVLLAMWMHKRGFLSETPRSPREARLTLLERCSPPEPGDEPDLKTSGHVLFTLVHSYSHRMMRMMSSFAGIDRDALAEYIVPAHLAFIIYARSTSDFVLGGLQALYENDLHNALGEFSRAEGRCPLDPGCLHSGGACMACLHVGEPSCRHFNRFLTREVLLGENGYLGTR